MSTAPAQTTARWDGWPPDPSRDGWFWVRSLDMERVVFWSANSRKWKRVGRSNKIEPQGAEAEAWEFLGEVIRHAA